MVNEGINDMFGASVGSFKKLKEDCRGKNQENIFVHLQRSETYGFHTAIV